MLLNNRLDLRRTLETIPASELERAKSTGSKIPVGRETRAGWSGYLEFYVLWCAACEVFSKDYAHGWPENQYVTCRRCSGNIRWNEREPHPGGGTVLVMSRAAAEELFDLQVEKRKVVSMRRIPTPLSASAQRGIKFGVAGGLIFWVTLIAVLFGGGKLAGFW